MAALAGCATPLRPQKTFFDRIGLPIGLQLYTLGPDAGRDLDATFGKVAQIGYREIELPNLLGHKPAELGAAARRAGLTISSLHLPIVPGGSTPGMPGMPGLTSASDPAEIADALGAMGASWAVAPLLLVPTDFRPNPGEGFGDAIGRSVAAAGEDLWKKTAEVLNRTASALRPLGVGMGYHNHNLEFAPIGKTTGWDILWGETEPGLVSFEVDIGWVATAGRDPVEFLERASGRVKLLHVKDVAADNPKSYRISMSPAEVGAGVLPWDRILPTAYSAGVRHFLVEQEPPFVIPRIEAAARSFSFLSQFKA
ncbi:MAG: sugar phosphate isomerase/epimerase [Novosphingobium sp.]|nr:sugar phosphate isomerase/epimerase [Novosphingobium sp.]MCP5403855.1 sugar phosphate isomerase/epimerase [Novosphingobium sp.]